MTGTMTTGAMTADSSRDCMLRPVTVADRDVIATLFGQVFDDRDWRSAELDALLAMPGLFGFLIRGDGGPAGCILLRQAADECELLWLAVQPDHRRQGLARRLLGAGAAEARSRRATRVVLEVARDNQPARAVYDSAGFRPLGERRDYYRRRDGSACDAVVMAARLVPAD